MKESDNIQMEINIAGETIPVNVAFDRQNFVRDTERKLGHLFRTWRSRFPKKTETELMAMMAYQYASFYYELLERHDKAADVASECLAKAEEILGRPDALTSD